MLGIPLLDNITSYNAASFLSMFIKVGVPIFTLINAGMFAAEIRTIIGNHKKNASKGSIITIRRIALFLLFLLLLFCILYGADGRYSRQDVNNISGTYFGNVKNGKMDGFGKLFDNENQINIIADYREGRFEGNLKVYRKDEDSGIVYLEFEGHAKNGYKDGYGQSYCVIAGERYPTYQGYFLEGNYNGSGYLIEYDDNGNKNHTYNGAWAYGKKSGYGVECVYSEEKMVSAQQGTYYNNKSQGANICEYFDSEDEKKVVWYGLMSGGEMTEDGAFYGYDGRDLYSTINLTRIENENGDLVHDETRLKAMKDRWPFPGRRLLIDREYR